MAPPINPVMKSKVDFVVSFKTLNTPTTISLITLNEVLIKSLNQPILLYATTIAATKRQPPQLLNQLATQ